MIHLDSAFLIDLLRETASDRPGAAFELIETLDPGEILVVSVHVVCELRAGAELARRPREAHEVLDELLSGLLVAYPDDRFAPAYARLLVASSRGKQRVAAMEDRKSSCRERVYSAV